MSHATYLIKSAMHKAANPRLQMLQAAQKARMAARPKPAAPVAAPAAPPPMGARQQMIQQLAQQSAPKPELTGPIAGREAAMAPKQRIGGAALTGLGLGGLGAAGAGMYLASR